MLLFLLYLNPQSKILLLRESCYLHTLLLQITRITKIYIIYLHLVKKYEVDCKDFFIVSLYVVLNYKYTAMTKQM